MHGSTPAPATPLRFLWPIDILRFVFALMVVCGHAYGFARIDAPDWHLGFFDRVERGGLWVAGFFVLSGYCIVAAQAGRAGFGFRRYMAARLTRILPLYGVFLVASVAAEAAFAAIGGRPTELWSVVPWTLFAQLTMTQGLFGVFGAYNPSWSLTHEIICYGIWGLLLAAVGRRMSGLAVLTWALVPLVAAVALHLVMHDEVSYRILSLPLYFFVWMLGAAAADSAPAATDPAVRRRVGFIALAVLPALGLYAATMQTPETVGMISFAALLAVACFLLPLIPRAAPGLEAISRRLGLASYPLYLGHGIVLVAWAVAEHHLALPTDPALRMTLATVTATVLAIAFGVPLERYWLRKRVEWMKRVG